MRKHVVILGAGFGGLELSDRLSESLADEVQVTLIDQNESFSFGFSKLDVMFGRQPVAELKFNYRSIAKPSVEFRQERVTHIDPESRRVTTDREDYEADILAVALGAEYDFAATPGFAEGGFEYYSIAGAERLHDALPEFREGKILLAILGHPFKCPPAPFEGALLLHDHLVGRGIRDAAEIQVIGPQSAPVPIRPEVSLAFLKALGERDIEYVADQHVESIDTESKRALVAGGPGVPYDLLIGVPVHRVPEVVKTSGLAPDGWVPVDQTNLRTRFDGVYALGDVAGLPTAKAGVFAEASARVVAEDIAASLHGEDPPEPYQGEGNCYIEFGGGMVGKVQANFLGGPRPTAELIGPTKELAEEKREFKSARVERWFS